MMSQAATSDISVDVPTRAVKSDQNVELVDEDTEREKKGPWWQRLCTPINQCFENITDCLRFWCCGNECYDFCCNHSDDVNDELEVAYNRDADRIDDHAALTFTSIPSSEVGYTNNGAESELQSQGDNKEIHGDNHGVNHTGGHHKTEQHAEGHHTGHHETKGEDGHGNHSGGDHHGGSDSGAGGGDCGGGYSGGGDCGGGED